MMDAYDCNPSRPLARCRLNSSGELSELRLSMAMLAGLLVSVPVSVRVWRVGSSYEWS